MEYKNLNDYELIYMIRENGIDKDLVFKKYKSIVENYAKKYYKNIINSSIDLEDLIQEGYIALNKAIDSYNDDNSLFYTFACICIKRNMLNYVNRVMKEKKIFNNTYSYNNDKLDINYLEVIGNNDSSPFDIALINSYKERILEIKNELSNRNSAIFELYYNGFSAKEIAILLDLKVNTVRSALTTIKRKFTLRRFRQLVEEKY